MCLPTLIRLHVDQRHLICECDVRLGVTFFLVIQHDSVGPPWVVSRLAIDLCVCDSGHIAWHTVDGDRDLLQVCAKA